MTGSENERHTLYHLQGKGAPREPWEVDVELIDDWLKAVDDGTYDHVVAALKILTEHGPGLGRPLVDSIIGSRHGNMKNSDRARLDGARYGSCSPSIPDAGRSCCWPETSKALGRSGTARTSPLPMTDTTSTWRS